MVIKREEAENDGGLYFIGARKELRRYGRVLQDKGRDEERRLE